MSNEKFTPAPWSIRKVKIDYHQHFYALEANLIPGNMSTDPVRRIGTLDMLGSYGHKWVFPNLDSSDGIDSSGSFNMSEIDAEANAHLIAAAPEMYEALKRLIVFISENKIHVGTDGSLNEDLDFLKGSAKSALAKANPQKQPA